MIIVRTVEWAEQALGESEIGCPHPGVRCHPDAVRIRPLPAAVQPRLADTTEVIGAALAHNAAGHGHRHQARPLTVDRAALDAPRRAHLDWLWQRGSRALIRLDPEAINQLPRATNPLHDALTALAAAASAARQRGWGGPHPYGS